MATPINLNSGSAALCSRGIERGGEEEETKGDEEEQRRGTAARKEGERRGPSGGNWPSGKGEGRGTDKEGVAMILFAVKEAAGGMKSRERATKAESRFSFVFSGPFSP